MHALVIAGGVHNLLTMFGNAVINPEIGLSAAALAQVMAGQFPAHDLADAFIRRIELAVFRLPGVHHVVVPVVGFKA